MRPSGWITINQVDLYRFVGVYDDERTPDPSQSYPVVPDLAAIRCSVQLTASERLESEDGRSTTVNTYKVIGAGDPPGMKRPDKLIWTDRTGTVHTLFVDGMSDNAARGMAWTAYAKEHL